MPSKPLKACSFPNCGKVSDSFRCEDHRSSLQLHIDERKTAYERGYDRTWQKFRLWFIKRHPVCSDCGIKATAEVHHVKKLVEYPALRLVESNCLGLCKPCHQKRTNLGE